MQRGDADEVERLRQCHEIQCQLEERLREVVAFRSQILARLRAREVSHSLLALHVALGPRRWASEEDTAGHHAL